MGFLVRSYTSAAVVAVSVATIVATPIDRPTPGAEVFGTSTSVNLTASSRMLPLWPVVERGDSRRSDTASSPASTASADPAAVADQIDESFIEFRTAARTDFTTFANQLGYLGKQLYIGVNFGESIAASAVFNGTDMLRGEGVLKNLGEFAYDVVLAGVYVVVDNLYLAIPGLPPIVVLPDRAPADAPLGWRRPLPPQPGRDLVVPVPYVPEPDSAQMRTDAATAVTEDEDAPPPDGNSETEDTATDVSTEVDDVEASPSDDADVVEQRPDVADETETDESQADETETDESQTDETKTDETDSKAPNRTADAATDTGGENAADD